MTLPTVVFWSAVAVFFVLRIRNDGLTVRDALLEILGRKRPAYRRAHVIFAVALCIGTLGLWYWLIEDCRAARI